MEENSLYPSETFTIYDEFKNFTPYLYAVWHDKRTGKFIAPTYNTENSGLYSFVRTFKGSGIVITSKGKFELPEGSLALFKKQTIKEYYPTSDVWDSYWFNFIPESEIPYFTENSVYTLPSYSDDETIIKKMFETMHVYNEYSIRLTNACFTELFWRWANCFNNECDDKTLHVKEITRIITYINQNISEDISIKALADECYLSTSHFRAVFREITGFSPKNYICRQRLKKVALLLKTTTSTINQIANDLHYSSPYQLSREFKKTYGISPKDYRKNF